MPEPEESGATAVAEPADAELDSALEAMLESGRPRDVEASSVPDASGTSAPPAAEAPPAEPASPVATDAAPDAEADEPDTAAEGEKPDDAAPPSRREAARLRQQVESLTKERDQYRTTAQSAGRLPEQANAAAAAWLGLVPEQEGQPAPYTALHEQATSREGIKYDDDQAKYNEFVERQKIIPSLWASVEQMVRAEQAQHLYDAEVGLDEDAVKSAGSLGAWKQQYRAAVEKTVDAKVRAELQPKIEELQQQLVAQKAQYEGRLSSARTTRAPITGGQSASRDPGYVQAPRTMTDVINNLAADLREEAGATV